MSETSRTQSVIRQRLRFKFIGLVSRYTYSNPYGERCLEEYNSDPRNHHERNDSSGSCMNYERAGRARSSGHIFLPIYGLRSRLIRHTQPPGDLAAGLGLLKCGHYTCAARVSHMSFAIFPEFGGKPRARGRFEFNAAPDLLDFSLLLATRAPPQSAHFESTKEASDPTTCFLFQRLLQSVKTHMSVSTRNGLIRRLPLSESLSLQS